jgi:hypothetical protein
VNQVSVDWPSIRSEWRRSDYEDLWLLVQSSDPESPSPEEVVAASDVATQAAYRAPLDDGTIGADALGLDSGTALYLTRTGTIENFQYWLDVFASQLGDRGVTGAVKAAKNSLPPRWLNELGASQLTLFVAYSGTPRFEWPPPAEDGIPWTVSEESTSRIVDIASSWTVALGGRVQVSLGSFMLEGTDRRNQRAVSSVLAQTLPHRRHGRIIASDEVGRRVRTSNFSALGLSAFCYVDESLSAPARLHKLLAIARETPELIDYAMVRYAPVNTTSWRSMSANAPGLDVKRGWYHLRRGDLDRAVPDAHAIQVLTSAHLEKAHDLSGWLMEDLGSDRYLVSARELAPWFRSETAEPDVVAAARSDFGDMIGFAP